MTPSFPTTDPSWNLDTLFAGGPTSDAFTAEVARLTEGVEALREAISGIAGFTDTASVSEQRRASLKSVLETYFELWDRVSEANSFAFSMACANADDSEAVRLPSRLDGVITGLKGAQVELQAKFADIEDDAMARLLGAPGFESMTLWLSELRRDAQRAMGRELELLAVELGRDGISAWGRLYSELTGSMEVEVEEDGEVKSYSIAQASNLLDSGDRATRAAAFEGLTQAWQEVAPICASTLNAIRGTEQTLFGRRGGDCLTRALQVNRVDRQSVEAMFEAAAEFRPVLVRYLQAKARALGLERLEWYDLRAPVGKQEDDEKIPYEEAQRFIAEQVDQFSPKIGDFCRHALANQWVEAEDRAGKRQGGYCTTLAVSKEIRIFMTYGGTQSGVTTLAHELGHGYHGHVMRDLPYSERNVPMGLAETASTFLEALVEQAALRQAAPSKRLALLDDRLNRAVTFLMHIHARYELEKEMHRLREEQSLNQDLLTEATASIFGEVYGDGVASVDPMIWASKLHFYLDRLPFYNFPYTFGYLFSRAVYDRAIEEGDAFVERIDDLLVDTGRMSSEEVARNHLDGDLHDPTFWKSAVGSLVEDVERYEALVDEA